MGFNSLIVGKKLENNEFGIDSGEASIPS